MFSFVITSSGFHPSLRFETFYGFFFSFYPNNGRLLIFDVELFIFFIRFFITKHILHDFLGSSQCKQMQFQEDSVPETFKPHCIRLCNCPPSYEVSITKTITLNEPGMRDKAHLVSFVGDPMSVVPKRLRTATRGRNSEVISVRLVRRSVSPERDLCLCLPSVVSVTELPRSLAARVFKSPSVCNFSAA